MSKDRAWGRARKTLTLATASLGMVAGTATPSLAHHVTPGPTTAQIMADCQSGVGKCTFGDGSPVQGESPGSDLTVRTYYDAWRKVSPNAPNCTTSPQRMTVKWAQSTGTTDTFGMSFKLEVGTILKASVETKFEHSWSETVTDGLDANHDVQPGHIGWVERAQLMNEYKGKWRTHYDDPKWGHYYWATGYDTIRTPVKGAQNGLESDIKWMERPMSRQELVDTCKWGYPPGVIDPGTTLRAGWQFQANLTRLVMQSDGNLVMYRLRDNKAIWASGTWGHPGAYAKMQTDGNFVIYDANNRFLWHTNTANYDSANPGYWAVLQNDGNFVIYKSWGGPTRGGAVWATRTTAAAQ
ncbi:hypothetical protein ACFVJ4_36485 [Streptomyces sp. NPDC127178]|uniref:hypothetical protein n=1 Tax=unclassified Streptomyces TaxID=2593676 RepID=UPI00364003FD